MMNPMCPDFIDSHVDLSAIDLCCETYKTRFAVSDDPVLFRSLKDHGLMVPLLLIENKSSYAIVSGLQRFHCLRKMHVEKCRALIIPADQCTPQKVFLYAVMANYGQTITDIDCMYVLAKAKERFSFSIDAICNDIAPLLGLPASRKVVQGYIQAYRIHDAFKQMMVAGKLSFKGAQFLATYDHDIQELFYATIFSNCIISASDIKNIAEYVMIIHRRDGQDLQDILKNDQLHCIIKNEKLDPKVKGERFIEILKEKAFPCMVHLKRRFKCVEKKLGISPDTTLEHTPFFEKKLYQLKIGFQSKRSLERSLASINENLDIFDELFSISEGFSIQS